MGYSSGSQSAAPTPEQTQQTQLTNQLLSTLVPTYQGVTTGAQNAYNTSLPYVNQAALQGFNSAQNVANNLTNGGGQALSSASNSLQNLVNPGYAQQVIQGAEQPVIEANRELQNTQNAQFGSAGGLGSSREALADASLSGLNTARESAAGANALAQITGQQIQGASNLGQLGQGAVTSGQAANQAALGFANAPQSAYSQYASTVFGVPTAASTGNFSGTQGASSKGFNI
jgi:hypothetical protein